MSRALAATAAVVLAALLWLPSPAARACGAFFPSASGGEATFGAQQALVVVKSDTVDVHVAVDLDATAEGVAWVVPVPMVPTLSLGDAAVFDQLADLTTPTISWKDEGGGGTSFGCALRLERPSRWKTTRG